MLTVFRWWYRRYCIITQLVDKAGEKALDRGKEGMEQEVERRASVASEQTLRGGGRGDITSRVHPLGYFTAA